MIQVTVNLTKKTYKLENIIKSGDESALIRVRIEDADTATLNHLKMGYIFSLDDITVTSVTFPSVGKVNYVSTGDIITETVLIESNKTYQLEVWAENGGDRFTKTFSITTPRSLQPYPSWTWDGNDWTPPIPKPTNGPKDASYKWSEKQQKWFHLVPPLHQFDDI